MSLPNPSVLQSSWKTSSKTTGRNVPGCSRRRPRGEVSGSVLAILGESMVYTASVLGITLYFSNEMLKFKRDTRKYLNDRENETNSEN